MRKFLVKLLIIQEKTFIDKFNKNNNNDKRTCYCNFNELS